MSEQAQSFSIPIEKIPAHPPAEEMNDEERAALKEQIKRRLKELDAVLVAHYYTDAELQMLADETGGYVSDSLDMARFGNESDASTLIVCGVRFMGETAKILNPEKRVLMPDLHANCSLDLGCPPDKFGEFCDAHPDHTVVVYANTSAAVKARADWMVTSGTAVDVVQHLTEQGEKVIWAPDKYLGKYVQEQSGCEMLLWDSACIVHEEFKAAELEEMRKTYPNAKVLVHPESPNAVVKQADFVGSTTGIIKAAQTMDADTFIVATDKGIFHKMQEAAPGKTFIEAPTAGESATCVSCAHCPWMAMNSLKKLANTLETEGNEIIVPQEIIKDAQGCITKLLDFTKGNEKALANDA